MQTIDLNHNLYSAYGWELALVFEPAQRQIALHSCRRAFGEDLMWHLQLERNGQPMEWTARATVGEVTLTGAGYRGVMTPCGKDQLRIDIEGCDLWLTMPKHFGYGTSPRPGQAIILSSQAHNYTGLSVAVGKIELLGPEEVLLENICRQRGSEVRIRAVDGRIRLHLKVGADEPDPRQSESDAVKVESEWEKFRADLPAVPARYRPWAEVAWWTLWSSFVRAEPPFASDACLMSKVFMCKVWSWDHCFNALALVDSQPRRALEQFLLPFHLQAKSGALPDCFSPNAEVIWAVSKPPVHGWAFEQMMTRHEYAREELELVYQYLERWSEYYRVFRDTNQDGLPEVPMGCDSQDNSAAFLSSFFVTSPDVAAYIARQYRCLARLARKLGWSDAAVQWEARCHQTVALILEHLWDGREFFCRDRDGQRLPERQASVLILPVCLGELLPRDVFNTTADRIESEFLGRFGVASQAFSSPLYRDDEYWLGTIWAPLQLLLYAGLVAGGRTELARKVAGGYLAAVKTAGGYYEGYNAKTGRGQRAKNYTWSAAVALELMRQADDNCP